MPDATGRHRDVLVRLTPYSSSDGHTAGLIGCITDVSEFREAAERTLQAKQAAESANAAKSEFLANISHELRTPLQTIIGFSELGSQRSRTDNRLNTMFVDIHGAGRRMLVLVNELLDLARLESTVGAVHRQPVNLAPALAEVCLELQMLAQTAQVQLRWPAADRTLWAQADVWRMQQVLRNVLANAIRHSPPGGQVTLDWLDAAADATAEPGMHCISVQDQGPGIPEGELDSIFEAFVQSSRTRSGAGGTGLGLAICRNIMRAHGGSIEAVNHAEGGAHFVIRLPVWTPTSADGLCSGAAPAANEGPPQADPPQANSVKLNQ
jgi:signal transduction histidine kinase